MKKITFLLLFVPIMLLFSFNTYASDVKSDIFSALDEEINYFKENLPDFVVEYFPDDFLEDDTINFSNILQEKGFWEYILGYFFGEIDGVIKSFTSIFLLLILSSIFSSISGTLKNESVKRLFSICITLCIALTVFNVCINISSFVSSYLKALCRVVNSFLPLMSVMSIMCGNITSAAVASTSMALFISIVESFLIVSLLPLVKICLAFACIKPIGGNDFSGLTKTVKTAFTSITIFTMTVFMFIFSLKNIISQGADTLSIKTAKFAISSFVPIVGASINDALRTVSSSLSIIKNSCGVIAIIVILLIIIPVIINLLLNKISFGFLSSVSKLIGLNSEGEILSEANSVCTFLLTLVACASVLFIFGLTIFIQSSVGIS